MEGRVNGQINDAIADFANESRSNDYGIGLEFHDKKSLTEFFQKTREFYPDSSIHIDAIFESGDHLIAEWTLQPYVAEPPYAGQTWKHVISLQGAAILRTENGKITDWTDYYDGLTARRSWVDAEKRTDSFNPATGAEIGTYADASREDGPMRLSATLQYLTPAGSTN